MNMNNNLESLDLITIISFIAQLQNIEEDKKEKQYIHSVILAIANEIEKLHKQNDRLEQKINQILQILKRR